MIHETVSRSDWQPTHLAPAGYFPSGKARPWRYCRMENLPCSDANTICRISYADGSVDYCPLHGLRPLVDDE